MAPRAALLFFIIDAWIKCMQPNMGSAEKKKEKEERGMMILSP